MAYSLTVFQYTFNPSQIWFHNVPFRQALYDWDPEEDEAERENDTLLMAER